jgi:hypothetical protein
MSQFHVFFTFTPRAANVIVIAAVNVVYRGQRPIVPMFTCGFKRSNARAIN